MCRQHHNRSDQQQPVQHGSRAESFPYHLPIYDAHCHPTDTMDSIASLDTMRASALAIMSTRAQDQDLVAKVASLHGVKDWAPLRGPRPRTCHQNDDDAHADHATTSRDADALVVQQQQQQKRQKRKCRVIPSFGWHPWFSHQMYLDAAPVPTYNPPAREHGAEEEQEEEGGGADASSAALLAAKKAHYQAVLVPAPQEDDFIASLPTPTPLSSLIASTRARLESQPMALVGEIGIDKAFRLPLHRDPPLASSRDDAPAPGGRQRRRLSPYRVQMQHQQALLRAQLRLAGELGRPVSIHGVRAHGILYDTIAGCWEGHERHMPSRREKKRNQPPRGAGSDDEPPRVHQSQTRGRPYPPRICLHSYSGSAEALKQWLRPNIPAGIFFSFSTLVNLGTEASRARFGDVVRALPGDRILVESDLDVAGGDMDAALQDMYRRVCEAKGWTLDEGVSTIGNNFERFILG